MTQRLSASRNIVGRNRIPVNYPEEAQCSLPLECNVFMKRGQWAINFTRATPATVTDFEWYVKPVLSGEVRFQNARRVQNLFSYSQETDNAYWTKWHCTIIANAFTAPDGTMTMDKIVGTATWTSYIHRSMSIIAGRKYRMSIYGKANGQDRLEIKFFTNFGSAIFNMSTGTITSLSWLASNATITSYGNGIYRMSTLLSPTTTVAESVIFSFFSSAWDQCYIWWMQLEDVTEQSNRSVGEYVSTNVLSSPFHGAFVDGVKYFNTRLDGTYIEDCGYYADTSSQNLCTRSEDFTTTWTTNGWLTVTPNSVASPWTTLASRLTLSTTPWVQFISFPLTVTAQRYWLSIYMKPNGHNLWQIATSSANGTGYVNFDISNGTVGTNNGYIIKTKLIRDWWYRIEVTTNTLTAAFGWLAIAAISSLTNGRLPSSTGTGTSGAYVWGAQIEATTPTSYMPTYGTTVTRNDDILTIDLKNTLSSQGTWFADTRLDIPSTISNLNITGSSLWVFGSTWASPWVYFSNGISVHDGTNTNQTSNMFLPNTTNKVAWGFSGSTMTIGLNGVSTTGTFDGTNSFTALCLGNATTLPRAMRWTIRNVQLWWYRLSDDDIALITTL